MFRPPGRRVVTRQTYSFLSWKVPDPRSGNYLSVPRLKSIEIPIKLTPLGALLIIPRPNLRLATLDSVFISQARDMANLRGFSENRPL